MKLSLGIAILGRLKESASQDYIGLIAAGMAFYFLMAAFPALAALISLYGLFSDPYFVTEQIGLLENFLPPEPLAILSAQATAIASSGKGTLSLSLLLSVVLSTYSATKGVRALIKGLNIAYDRKERRNVVVLTLTAFALTIGMMVYLLTALTLVAAVPIFFGLFPWIGGWLAPFLFAVRWVFLFLMALVGLQILYRYGPSGPSSAWRWVSWGAATATILWIGVCSLFSMFVSNFGKYNETYGSISAVIVLLLWLWLSALTVLIGAEVNAVLEGRRRDGAPAR